MQTPPALPRAADEIDLGPLLRSLLRYWPLLILLTALGAGVGWGVSWTQRPVFRATALLAPVHSEENGGSRLSSITNALGDVGALMGLGSGKTDEAQEAMATLSSRILTEAYIRQNQLVPVIFHDYWDPASERYVIPWWKFWMDDPSLQTATTRFDKKIRHIVENKKTGMIELSVDWRDPRLAAKWANDVAQVTNTYLRQREIERGNRSLAYLNSQLERTSVVELRQALFRLIESELKRVMQAQGNEEFAFRVVDPAVVPERKIRPDRILYAILGGAAGIVISVIVVGLLSLRPERPQRGGVPPA